MSELPDSVFFSQTPLFSNIQYVKVTHLGVAGPGPYHFEMSSLMRRIHVSGYDML